MPPGQPTAYEERFCEMLIEHMAEGYSFESFAGKIRVCRSTLYNWTSVHPKFLDAKEVGMEVGRLWWEGRGITVINGTYPEGMKFSNPIYTLIMKNRFGYREEINHTINAPPAPASPEEAAAALKEMLSDLEKTKEDGQ